MAIRATEIDNNSTIEQLRVQFNNLITDGVQNKFDILEHIYDLQNLLLIGL